ncbi:MAG: hypothetical protein PVF96_04635 [Candidatus Bathyarchaeota archaeon]|jgi:predicted transcriptional regulator
MILPCEIAVKSVIPAIRATMAMELVESYKLKQDKVAEILGISQSAVSKYTRHIRGHVIDASGIKEIQPLVKRMLELLLKENTEHQEFLTVFCKTCLTIRKKGLMCEFCRMAEPKFHVKECDFCQVKK